MCSMRNRERKLKKLKSRPEVGNRRFGSVSASARMAVTRYITVVDGHGAECVRVYQFKTVFKPSSHAETRDSIVFDAYDSDVILQSCSLLKRCQG